MIIYESGLARMLKRAYSKGGYTMAVQGDSICFYTEAWFVNCNWKKIPKKGLAAVMEHVGYEFAGATALFVRKKLDPQFVMADVIDADLCEWQPDGEGELVTCVPVTYKGMQLFQNHDGAGVCYGANPEYLELLEPGVIKKPAVTQSGPKLVWGDEDGIVAVKAARLPLIADASDREKTIWRALESLNLH